MDPLGLFGLSGSHSAPSCIVQQELRNSWVNGQLTSWSTAILVLVILDMEDHISVVRILRGIELGRYHKQSSTVPEHSLGPPKGAWKMRQKASTKCPSSSIHPEIEDDHLQQKHPAEVILIIQKIVGNWRLSYELHQLYPIPSNCVNQDIPAICKVHRSPQQAQAKPSLDFL